MREALEEAIAAFPAWQRRVAERQAENRRLLDEAREEERADRFVKALELVRRVCAGSVRTGPEYDEAHDMARRLEPRAERERE